MANTTFKELVSRYEGSVKSAKKIQRMNEEFFTAKALIMDGETQEAEITLKASFTVPGEDYETFKRELEILIETYKVG